MNVDANISADTMSGAETAGLLSLGFEGLGPFTQKSKELRQTLVRLGKIGDKATNRAARKLHHQLKHAEPSVTMIGQVKASKTSLVNAMVGLPDLLPADVNPWTSVVTSLHLNPHTDPEENKARFEANPAAFVPQYDGHCAYGVSKGGKVPGNPELWRIVDGKLYLNYSKSVQKNWEKDVPGHIASGDKNWPKVLN